MSTHSKKILKRLAEKPAVKIEEFKEKDAKTSYALTRALKNLVEAGCAEIHKSGRQDYVKITPHGKTKLDSMALEGEDMLVPQTWDGFWRIVLLDLPENRKSERESLRYLLKKANFICLKNSAWISPYPYEHLLLNIKNDLGLKTEMMVIVTKFIDDETKNALFEIFGTR